MAFPSNIDRKHEVFVLVRNARDEVKDRASELILAVDERTVKNMEVAIAEWRQYHKEAKELRVVSYS